MLRKLFKRNNVNKEVENNEKQNKKVKSEPKNINMVIKDNSKVIEDYKNNKINKEEMGGKIKGGIKELDEKVKKYDEGMNNFKIEMEAKHEKMQELMNKAERLREENKDKCHSEVQYLVCKLHLESGVFKHEDTIKSTTNSMNYWKDLIPYDKSLKNNEISYKEYVVKRDELRDKYDF